MSFTAVILINVGVGIALLAILAATMRLPFRIPHPHSAGHGQRTGAEMATAQASVRSAESRRPHREPATAGRSERRSWSQLPDQA
jgi:hypothetical protein